MSRKFIPLIAVLGFGIGSAAQAQTNVVPVPLDPTVGTVTVKQTPNMNVTKIDGTILGTDVKAMQNPAQIKVKVKGPESSKAMVKLPTNATSIDDATKVKVKAPKLPK